MSWTRILVINIFVLSGLLIATEMSVRIAFTARDCYKETCDFYRLLSLKIYNDDVACAHGATVSQLSEESLHYLRSRGLGPDAAYRMLNFAFINELLDGASEPPLAEYLRTRLQNWFEQEAP